METVVIPDELYVRSFTEELLRIIITEPEDKYLKYLTDTNKTLL